MRILLADDERMVRLSLESMLKELYPEEHEYYHVSNGKEVIGAVNTNKPSLVFLDIKMPGMSGLEALEECKKLAPGTAFIILSGYANFDYARQAVALGAEDYLLKPASLDDVKRVVEKAKEHLEISIKNARSIFASEAYDFFTSTCYNENAFPSGHNDSHYNLFVIYETKTVGSDETRDAYSLLSASLEKSSSVTPHSLFFLPTGEMIFFTSSISHMEVAALIRRLIQNYSIGALTVFNVLSGDPRELYESVRTFKEIAPLRHLGLISGLIGKKDCEKFDYDKSVIAFGKLIGKYIDLISDTSKDCVAEISALFYKSHAESYNRIKTKNANYVKLQDEYLKKLGLKPTGASNYDSFVNALRGNSIENTSIAEPFDLIDKIKLYVNSNYKEDVSINIVADALGISPSYLSRVFHQRTGEKYIDYVTNIRISHAKVMLDSNNSYSIKTISESVGYLSSKYFSKNFKKVTGLTPNEYLSRK